MSATDRETIDAVAKLLNERRKVSDWLSALAPRRDDTLAAVFQKVHDDYAAKLEKIQAKLAAASDAVHVAATDLAARLTEREQTVAAKHEERAEYELRHSVGEYSEKEWDKRRTKLDEELAVMVAERDSLREELQRLRDVLDEVAGRAEPAEPPDAWRRSPEPKLAAIPIQEQVPRPAATAPAPRAPSLDDLAFLQPVAAPSAPVVPRAVEAVPPAASSRPADRVSARAADPAPARTAEPAPVRGSQRAPERSAERVATRATDGVKSLRCNACETLNSPTEWYCEHCGGELVAL